MIQSGLWLIVMGMARKLRPIELKNSLSSLYLVFGEFKHRIATGVYGNDLYEALLHIAHNGKRQLWNLGLRRPVAQRIAKCAGLGLW